VAAGVEEDVGERSPDFTRRPQQTMVVAAVENRTSSSADAIHGARQASTDALHAARERLLALRLDDEVSVVAL
jgi:hypothetical protein